MFTDINIYPINNKTDHISEKRIFYRKKSKTKVYIFSILSRIWSRIRIRIRIKMDPKHWKKKGNWKYIVFSYFAVTMGIQLTIDTNL